MTVGDDGHCHTDLLIGLLIASLFTIVDAVSIGAEWQLVPARVLVRTMASAEVSRVPDWEAIAVESAVTNVVE